MGGEQSGLKGTVKASGRRTDGCKRSEREDELLQQQNAIEASTLNSKSRQASGSVHAMAVAPSGQHAAAATTAGAAIASSGPEPLSTLGTCASTVFPLSPAAVKAFQVPDMSSSSSSLESSSPTAQGTPNAQASLAAAPGQQGWGGTSEPPAHSSNPHGGSHAQRSVGYEDVGARCQGYLDEAYSGAADEAAQEGGGFTVADGDNAPVSLAATSMRSASTATIATASDASASASAPTTPLTMSTRPSSASLCPSSSSRPLSPSRTCSSVLSVPLVPPVTSSASLRPFSSSLTAVASPSSLPDSSSSSSLPPSRTCSSALTVAVATALPAQISAAGAGWSAVTTTPDSTDAGAENLLLPDGPSLPANAAAPEPAAAATTCDSAGATRGLTKPYAGGPSLFGSAYAATSHSQPDLSPLPKPPPPQQPVLGRSPLQQEHQQPPQPPVPQLLLQQQEQRRPSLPPKPTALLLQLQMQQQPPLPPVPTLLLQQQPAQRRPEQQPSPPPMPTLLLQLRQQGQQPSPPPLPTLLLQRPPLPPVPDALLRRRRQQQQQQQQEHLPTPPMPALLLQTIKLKHGQMTGGSANSRARSGGSDTATTTNTGSGRRSSAMVPLPHAVLGHTQLVVRVVQLEGVRREDVGWLKEGWEEQQQLWHMDGPAGGNLGPAAAATGASTGGSAKTTTGTVGQQQEEQQQLQQPVWGDWRRVVGFDTEFVGDETALVQLCCGARVLLVQVPRQHAQQARGQQQAQQQQQQAWAGEICGSSRAAGCVLQEQQICGVGGPAGLVEGCGSNTARIATGAAGLVEDGSSMGYPFVCPAPLAELLEDAGAVKAAAEAWQDALMVFSSTGGCAQSGNEHAGLLKDTHERTHPSAA